MLLLGVWPLGSRRNRRRGTNVVLTFQSVSAAAGKNCRDHPGSEHNAGQTTVSCQNVDGRILNTDALKQEKKYG